MLVTTLLWIIIAFRELELRSACHGGLRHDIIDEQIRYWSLQEMNYAKLKDGTMAFRPRDETAADNSNQRYRQDHSSKWH